MPRRPRPRHQPTVRADNIVNRPSRYFQLDRGRRVPVPSIYPYANQPRRSPTRSSTRSPSFGPVFGDDNDNDNDSVMPDAAGPDNNDWEDIEDDNDVADEEDGVIDQDALLSGDIDFADIRRRLADLEVDEQELRMDIEYGEREFDRQEPNTVEFDEDFVDEWVAEQVERLEEPEIIEGVTSHGLITDKSKLLRHYCNKHEGFSDFEMLFGLYVHINRMSRKKYKTWVQMLGALRGRDGHPIPVIERLPKQQTTLKKKILRRLPLLDMRVVKVPLQISRMRTESARQKLQDQRKTQQDNRGNNTEPQAGSDSDQSNDQPNQPDDQSDDQPQPDPNTVPSPLYFMDPKSLFQAFLNSDTAATMHKGMAHLVDNPTELYHMPCWSSSIRTTSGEYAHFVSNSEDNGKAIFPSDFIYFYCCKEESSHCNCRLDEDHPDYAMHIGRVKAVGKNYTDDFYEYAGEVTIIVNECVDINTIEQEFPGLGMHYQVGQDMHFRKFELVMRVDEEHWIPQHWADQFAPVNADYFDGNDLDDPSPAVPGKRPRQNFAKYSTEPYIEKKKNSFLVRRVFDKVGINEKDGTGYRVDPEDSESERQIYPLAYTSPPRAELEIKAFGRAVFEEQWDKVNGGMDVLSCPVLTFIDGFGVYRNARRSVMGMYQSPAGLSFGNGRARNANIFPLVLGPHASNFDDVVKCLGSLMPLDQGMVMMEIHGRPTMVSAFTLCYTGDMPQQNQNAGVVGIAGYKFCRFCFVGPEHVVNQQDVIRGMATPEINRFHHQHIQMRYEVDNNLFTEKDRAAYRTQWGISKTRPALFDLTPALDTIMTRAPDPAHSEYKGMIAATHEMLRDVFFTSKARVEYSRVLKNWPFPSGWSALPSPISYLDSYNLSQHAQWSIIIPPLLEAWLRKDHINRHAWKAWKAVVQPDRVDSDGEDNNEDEEESDKADGRLLNYIVHTMAMMAQSNSVLMNTRNTKQVYEKIENITVNGRIWYERLCQAAACAVAKNPRAHQAFGSRARYPSQISSRRSSASRPTSAGGRSASGRSGSGLEDDVEMPDNVEIFEEDEEQGVVNTAAEATNLPKRAKEYIKKALRPNIHLGMHYSRLYDKYGPPSLLNVLAEEKYHKRLKATAQTTNGKDIEKWILEQERIIHTIRFTLLNSFTDTDRTLTEQIHVLAQQAPTLFEDLLQRNDKVRLGITPTTPVEEEELDIPSAGENHLRPSIIGKFEKADMRNVHHPIVGHGNHLPLSSRQMSDAFRRALSAAYELDYGIDVKRFGPGAIQYSNRVSFADPTFRRHTFSVGDNLRYRNDNTFGRIDHIFTHEQSQYNERYIFLVITKMVASNTDFNINLELPRVYTQEALIIGLPAVLAERVYIVDVSKLHERQRRDYRPALTLVSWDIIWM